MAGFYLLYFVKHFPVILTALLLCSFYYANAQNEDWDTYMAKFGDKPGSVLVDMALMRNAPDSRYPYLVITGPKAHRCDKQGLPEKDEINTLENILDGTSSFLTGVTAKVLTGTFTSNCERLNYYYVKDTPGIRNAVMRMYGRNYDNYSYVLKIRPDREWITYRTFLYPNEDNLNWMENDKIISKMLLAGDSLTKARNINFELWFKTDSARTKFSKFAVGKGYKADKKVESRNKVAPFGIIVTWFGYINTQTMNVMTDELKKEASLLDGFYNSWEAKL